MMTAGILQTEGARKESTGGFMTPDNVSKDDSNFNDSLFDGMYNPDQLEVDFENLPKISNHSSNVVTIKGNSDSYKYLVLFLFCCS
jgi:hypothetical protein